MATYDSLRQLFSNWIRKETTFTTNTSRMRIFDRKSKRASKQDAIKVCEEHVVHFAKVHEEVASSSAATTCDGPSAWARGLGGHLQRIGEIFSPPSKRKVLTCADTNIDVIETFSLSSEEDYQESGDRYTSVFQSPHGKPGCAAMSFTDPADPATLPNPLHRQPRDMKARLDLPCGKYSKNSILKKVKQLVEQDADSLLGGGLDIYQELVNNDSGIQDFCVGDIMRVDSNGSKRTFRYNLPGSMRLEKQQSGGSMNIKVIDTGEQVVTSPMTSINSCSQSGSGGGSSTSFDNSTRVSTKVSEESTVDAVDRDKEKIESDPAPLLSSWMQSCAALPLPEATHDDDELSSSTAASTKVSEKAKVGVTREDEDKVIPTASLSWVQSCPGLPNTVSDLDDDMSSSSTKVSEASTKLSLESTKASEASMGGSRTSTEASRTSTRPPRVSSNVSIASTKFSKGSSKFKRVAMKTSKPKMKALGRATQYLPNTLSNIDDDKSLVSTRISISSSKSSRSSTGTSCASTMTSGSTRTANAEEDCGQLVAHASLPWIKSCAGLRNLVSDLDDEKSSGSTKVSTTEDNPVCRKATPLINSVQSCAAPLVDEATAIAVTSIHKYSQLSCPLLDSKRKVISGSNACGKISADYMYSFEESSNLFDEDDITFHSYDTLSTKSMNTAFTTSDSSDGDTSTDHSTDTNSDSCGTEQQMSQHAQSLKTIQIKSNARTLLTDFRISASNLQDFVKESYRRMPSLLTTSQDDRGNGIIVPEPRKRLGMPHASLIEFGNSWNMPKEHSAASIKNLDEK